MIAKPDPDQFTNGIVVYDEYGSLSQSHGGDWPKNPMELASLMRAIVKVSKFVVAMDRDITLTLIPAAHLQLIAPNHDVLYLQARQPSDSLSIAVRQSLLGNHIAHQTSLVDHHTFVVRRLQFKAAGQPNRRFCYAFGTKRHDEVGRGRTCAMVHFNAHVEKVRDSFEKTVDDGNSPTGPSEWKRLFVAVSSKVSLAPSIAHALAVAHALALALGLAFSSVALTPSLSFPFPLLGSGPQARDSVAKERCAR